MKRFLLAGAALLALTATQPTLAADAPVYRKGPAPAAIALFNWSGFYIGGHVGGIWGSVEDQTFAGGDPRPSGWIGGVLAGVNYQAGNWVFGIEGDYGWASTTGSNVPPGFLLENNIEYLANIRGRLGLAMDRVLFFIAGGASFTNLRLNHSGGPSVVTNSFTGWNIGAGIDWAATNNFILRAEYIYSDFGTATYGFFGGGDPHVIDLRNIQVVRGAAIWKF